MFKKIALSLCFTLFLGLLSACSPDAVLHLKKDESQAQNTPETTTKSSEISAPIALPPQFGDAPLKPGQSNTQYMPNGLTALKPMKGINANTLFADKIKNTDQRFERVENAVLDLRREFDTYEPAIVRLTAVEADIQNLIKELEVLLQETPAQQPPLDLNGTEEAQLQVSQLDTQPTPPPDMEEIIQATTPKTSPPPKLAEHPPPKNDPLDKPPEKAKDKEPPPPNKHYDGIVAQNLRAGEHADKVRIVIDTNKSTDFTIDLDNDERLIIIETPNARWVGDMKHSFTGSSLLDSYSVESTNDGQGSMIVLSLKKATSIIQKNKLSPDSDNSHHRIYFDLKP